MTGSALDQRTRLFDVEEADRMLPLVRSIVRGMIEDWETRRDAIERLEALPPDRRHEAGQPLHAEVDALTEKLVEAAEELADLGVEFKGIEEGLVDFPARRDGELVYLCWKYGEDRVAWWHPVDAGFAGRRPLERD